MEGTGPAASAELARYEHDHPDVSIFQVEGIWRAELPDSVTCAHSLRELLAKLGG